MERLWYYDHYEQNEDHRELNDHACWSADENHLYCSMNDENETSVVVSGDIQAALVKLREETSKKQEWPSLWLGPQCRRDWEEVCEALGLSLN